MHHQQDIRHMGGLRKYIPWTYLTFLVSTFAIAGFPPFAGFFSKDEILWKAFSTPNEIGTLLPYVVWLVGLIAAGMTSFYMFRLVFKTFHGELRVDESHRSHLPLKEIPVMYIPLILLGIGAIVGGFMGVPDALGGSNWIHSFLGPVFGEGHASASLGTLVANAGPELHVTSGHDPSVWTEYGLMALSIAVATIGLLVAIIFYIQKPGTSERLRERCKGIYKILLNKYYVDELYDATFVRGLLLWNAAMKAFDNYVIDGLVNLQGTIFRFSSWFIGLFDNTAVDGAVNLVGNTTIASGRKLKFIQTGRIQNYLYILLGGAILLVIIKLL